MGEKKNVITNLVELGKRNQKITTKEINNTIDINNTDNRN